MRADPYAESAERFARDTGPHTHEKQLPYGASGPCQIVTDRPHEMIILLDAGEYRHLRFMSPDHSWHWFDLITWPGCLTIRGDFGDAFTFARVTDMFEFFRGRRINPTYWSEKLDGDSGRTMTYSEPLFRRSVWEHVRTYGQDHRGLAKAVQEHFFDRWSSWDTSNETEARQALDDFEFTAADRKEPFRFVDTWEWSLRDFDWSFLWACQAIVWGIARYDEARQSAAAGRELVGVAS
jgi:hypothetical protein